MSTLLAKPTVLTADGRKPNIIASRILIATSSTSTSRETINRSLIAASEMTTSGVTTASTSSPDATQKALSELRRLSGLTWDQLARLFNVSRRSLHFWASGQPLSHFNEEHLNRLLGTVRYIDQGSANLNRSLLLHPDSNGNPLLDLLVVGKYEEFKRIVGSDNAPRRPSLGFLSRNAHTAYIPQNPADLVDALQEPIHHEVGRSRPARSVRNRKNSSDQ
jgi:DNA-binding transcriptional regulator YiaG